MIFFYGLEVASYIDRRRWFLGGNHLYMSSCVSVRVSMYVCPLRGVQNDQPKCLPPPQGVQNEKEKKPAACEITTWWRSKDYSDHEEKICTGSMNSPSSETSPSSGLGSCDNKLTDRSIKTNLLLADSLAS